MKTSYYSIRSGKKKEIKINLEKLKTIFLDIYHEFCAKGYFTRNFGILPNGSKIDEGKFHNYKSVNNFLFEKAGSENLWPIESNIVNYTENELFDIIEFTYNFISKPIFLDYFGNEVEYNSKEGKIEYRKRINVFLNRYNEGFKVSEDGYILLLIDEGFENLINAEYVIEDQENINQKISFAIDKYLRSRRPDDLHDAVKTLSDVLEFLRPQLKQILTKKDESDLFQIINNFGIRHHRSTQQNNYDKTIFHRWMFYYFLATIHAAQRLIKKEEDKN